MVNADFGNEWYGDNITEPCKLCRKESVSVSGDMKYCVVCYKELIQNAIIN